ncbi:MAG TPA: RHS repeat-associated core domain-containing protein, partial [Vicinamibacterales bacterium]|nr:RHS repeat-associated core domain-containing protein [Vicinamibacterales bacterium]
MSYRFERKRAVVIGLLVLYVSVTGPSLPAWQQAPDTRAEEETPKAPNRSLPTVKAPVLAVQFDEWPSTDDLVRARVLPTPLRPAGGVPGPDENRALARTLEQFAQAPSAVVLEQFLAKYPVSPWRAAILVNVGQLFWRDGYFSRAARSWDEAWMLAKDSTERSVRDLADDALAEWLTQAMTFGQVDALQRRLDEVATRAIGGPAGNKVNNAREGLWQLTNHHEMALFSGPEALKAVLAVTKKESARAHKVIAEYHPPHEGTSLVALQELSRRADLPLEMRFVADANEIPVPSIVHLKSDHYSAVVARGEGSVMLRDPALGGELAMSVSALRDEASGFVLVPARGAQSVGRHVETAEGERIFGHCMPGVPAEDQCGCGSGPPGMPTYSLHPSMAAVVVTDTPMAYTPPRGPAMPFTLRYNHRTMRLGTTPTSSHVGPLWSFDWISYVQDNISILAPPWSYIHVVLRGEGVEQYTGSSGYTHWRSRAALVQVAHNPPRYERRLPDGTTEIYAFPDRAASLPNRKVFLTEVIDPQGHTLTFTYDASFRLVGVTDAVGQVTTLEYQDPTDPLLVTKVTDPFGRMAMLSYDGSGRLLSITDAIGMTSRFAYDDTDFMTSMTTPYGTTTFRRGPDSLGAGSFRRVEATDPEGGTERLEYHLINTLGLPATTPPTDVPAGFEAWNQDLDKWTSFYWSKQAMAEAPGDVARAVITRWLLMSEMAYAHSSVWNVPHSVKRPLETRIWYRYPGQHPSVAGTAGIGRSPTLIARVLEGGTTQLTQYAYNAQGMVTSETDPLGRMTTYAYGSNGIDLLEIRQISGGGTDILASYGGFDARHLPATIMDSAGQTTTATYNSVGKILTLTNSKKETTVYTYDTEATGYLTSVSGPLSGSTTSYTYDLHGRIRTETSPDGYTITTDYDALNRITKRTFPDETFEQFIYSRLDLVERRDRKGRVTRLYYDGVGRLRAARDPLGRVIRQEWCPCGTVRSFVDGNGNRTTWERDAQGRRTRELRGGGTIERLYTYDATGRLATITDAMGQVTTNTYFADDTLHTTTYSNTVNPTPGVTYTYDAAYPRLTSMVDGQGTTTFTYKVVGQLGAGELATLDGPLPNDVIAYAYDELGRATMRSINGSANSVTWTFDALGRKTSEITPLGEFAFTYDGLANRLATITYPSGQTTTYNYTSTVQNSQLQTIHNKYPGGATLSKFDYTYDVLGNVLQLQEQFDASQAIVWTYEYDSADQLVSAVKQTSGPSPTVLNRHRYGYDTAGNRVYEQTDNEIVAAAHDNLNRLTTLAPGGPILFRGTVSEPANVVIQGAPALVDASNGFRGTAPLPSGTSTVSVVATDPSGNQATRQYEVNATGTSKMFTYDPNGNMLSDGTRTFDWDAKNRLIAVTGGAERTEFTYDGLDRRITTTHKTGGTVTSSSVSIWCGVERCESRSSVGIVSVRHYSLADQENSETRYLTKDHLSSVRDVVDGVGNRVASYEYDPWGRTSQPAAGTRTFASGVATPVYGTVSMVFRDYDPNLGRWLSEDPSGLSGGPNLLGYASNRPTVLLDPLGLVAGTIDEIPIIKSVPRSATGGACGRTLSDREVYGECNCKDGIWYASLTLNFSGTILIAKNLRFAEENWVLSHEMKHFNYLLGVARGAKRRGEVLESNAFSSEWKCNLAVG